MITHINQITEIEAVADRFWSHVRKSDSGCWPWTLGSSKSGYGKLSFFTHGVKHHMRAHRMSYLLTTGTLPEPPIIIRHTCHNRMCCNPHHLEPGTHQDNMDDMVEAGRTVSGLKLHPERAARGASNGNTPLIATDVLEMRRLRNEGWTYQRIADKFGVTKRTAINIDHRITWSHI